MANPFGITQVDVPGMIGMYEQGKQARLSDMLVQRKLQQEEAASARQARVSDMIRNKAKPDEVMAEDFDTGAKYAEYLGKMDEQNRKRAVDQAGVLVNVGTSLSKIPAGPARLEAMRQAAPLLKQIGIPEEMLSQFDPNDDNALKTIVSSNRMLLGAGEQYTLSPGSARYDAYGNLIASQPFAPQYKTVGEGDNLYEIPAANPAADSRGMRNNNPGNIEDGDFARGLPGYQGSDGRFAIFDSPDAGANAQVALLGSYGKRGVNTVEQIINRWAPPSDNNPTGNYVSFVSRELGVDPRQPLNLSDPRTARAVASAISKFENGSGGGSARVIAQGAPKQKGAPSGYRWRQDGTLEPIPGGPATRATVQNKAIPDSTAKRVEGDVSSFQALDRAIRNFRPDYGGNLLGGAENIAQGVFGVGTPGQRDWWADFKATDNLIRNQLFGSALTEHEKRAYESTTINPAMAPAEITKNLQRRREIVSSALQRRANFLKKSGYNPAAVDALMGGDALAGQVGNAPPASGVRPTRTAINPKTGERLGLINGQWVKM